MRPIPLATRERIANDPYYQRCARQSAECSGRTTIEHSMKVRNRQIDDYWNLIPLCVYHHLGRGLDKEYNRYLALRRATDEDLAKYPKTDFKQMKKYLIEKYERF
jgi:hypothetical protein